jgi:hypothetical protein
LSRDPLTTTRLERSIGGGERMDGPSECDGSRTDRELAAEYVDARLAELPKWLTVKGKDGFGDRRRAEASVDELKTRRAALAQADPQLQERAHGDAIVSPRRPSLVHGDGKGQNSDNRGTDRNDDTRVHQLASS